jgi:type I restriction enzyme S subunit
MKSPWPTKKLEEICEKIKAGGTPSRKISKYWGGEIPFVKIEDLTSVKLYLENTQEKITQEGLENSNAWILPPNSVLFSIYASIGEVAINKIPVATNQAILGLIPKSEIVDPKFLAYSLKKFGKYLISYNIQSTQKNLTLEIVKNFEIPLPPLPIQQKIVKILDTIQSAVEIQEKIIEKTKELKKSMMAELFKYGGPSFRKGRKLKKTDVGEIPEDWEVVRLGEVCEKVISGDWGKGEKYPNSRSCKVIRGTDFSLVQNGKLTNLPDRYVDERKFEKLKLKYGDILVEISGGSEDQPTGRVLFWNKNENLPIIFSNFVKKILLNVKLVKPEYFFRYWQFLYFKGVTKNYEERTTNIRNFKFKEFLENEKIPLLPLLEQQEIAEILQTIDQKIEIEKKKKELYEELFKTMLNKIMSGEIMVNDINF